ncbi:paramyosin-like [Eublepharis macularius]|uniref:Paramyosin-like n=1 Tax=Eublepharis macularius TaxID=481883 RepID=A0AA97JQV4_EUBMA|nr:paramyosin-like [Eublepharis macularius]
MKNVDMEAFVSSELIRFCRFENALPYLIGSSLAPVVSSPPPRNMDSLNSIEVEYIKNLQKQICLLEFETSFLREKAKKATSIQPSITREAEKILQKMKELEATINTAQMEIAKKEGSCKTFETEIQAMQRHLQTLSDANTQEKRVLIEDATNLKKLAALSTQDVLHKEAELLNIQQELQKTINTVKEKEHNVHLLETQLQQQIQKLQDAEGKLAESRSECIQLQALLQQLEETHLTGGQSTQQHIAKELRRFVSKYSKLLAPREEAEKLKQILKERELSADEDRYLHNKMAEDCGDLEKKLREEENTSHSRRVSELVSGKEEERHLEMELTYLTTLLQDCRKRVLKAQDQVISLQQDKESVDQTGHSLQSQLRDLQRKHSSIQLENSKLQTEKTHLVEYVSHLHKQIAEKEKEIHCLYSHANSLSSDLSNLKSHVDTASHLQGEKVKSSPVC